MSIKQVLGLVIVIEAAGYLVTGHFTHELVLEFAGECKKAIDQKKNSSNNDNETA